MFKAPFACRFPTSYDGSKGRQPTDSEAEQLLECTFKTSDGLKMDQNLECVVTKAASDLNIGAISSSVGAA
jgi:hypothetical protein